MRYNRCSLLNELSWVRRKGVLPASLGLERRFLTVKRLYWRSRMPNGLIAPLGVLFLLLGVTVLEYTTSNAWRILGVVLVLASFACFGMLLPRVGEDRRIQRYHQGIGPGDPEG